MNCYKRGFQDGSSVPAFDKMWPEHYTVHFTVVSAK